MNLFHYLSGLFVFNLSINCPGMDCERQYESLYVFIMKLTKIHRSFLLSEK